jgi:hypothetical protein
MGSELRIIDWLFRKEDDAIAARLDWISSFYPSESIRSYWDEGVSGLVRESFDSGLTISTFQERSRRFPVVLLREEVPQLYVYYRYLRSVLRARVLPGEPVYVFGPTVGGDLEMIHDAGGIPCLVTRRPSRWQEVLEERLFEDDVPFETISRARVLSGSEVVKKSIITPWEEDTTALLRTLYNLSGRWGFLFGNTKHRAFTSEAERLRLSPYKRGVVSTYLKDPAHPEEVPCLQP